MHSQEDCLFFKVHWYSRCYPPDIPYSFATPLYVAALDGVHAYVCSVSLHYPVQLLVCAVLFCSVLLLWCPVYLMHFGALVILC